MRKQESGNGQKLPDVKERQQKKWPKECPPITLLADDGETEKTFPFTKEKWPLLDSETMKEERIEQEEGGIYVSKFTLNEPVHKVFEAGYEESEIDLRVEFEQAADG